MQKLRKPVSILLSVAMILSMFTILSVTSASAATVQVFARKRVRAEQVTGDYFSFTDLYKNFIICRCNPHFDETNYDVDDTTNVYDRTENITLDIQNEIRLNSWNNGNGTDIYCMATGAAHYIATAEFNGQTFTAIISFSNPAALAESILPLI